MPYKGDLVSIGEMVDELIQHGRDERRAASELSRALEDSAIILVFNDAPLSPSQIAGIAEYIQTVAVDRQQARLRFGWTADIVLYARASRSRSTA